ncbi:hypothetical protein B0A48_12017 [Cryoendolithus antarcticus]|uniref:Folic acid synthesis protein FOL1 n=1 Tax=Cryoendolithus antarcticus TaxID=1507870 RepID=A0A1V8STV2_9PEZI|nr:hypothetical protein B0A48_12017 [Cryoendolithus antarcticus]
MQEHNDAMREGIFLAVSQHSRDDSLDALATHISEVIIATLEQVSGNVTFDDGATVPKLLAESVLEIVRELTPGLDLTGSSLCTARDNDLDVAVVGSKNPRTSSDSPHAPELEAIPRDQDDLRVPFASADSLGDQFRDPHGVLASTEQYDLNEGAGTGSAMQYRIGGGSILLEKTGAMQSPMIAMKALGGAVGGARSSQLDIFITLKHAFSAGLSCHRQGLLLPIDIWISLRSQEVQAMNEDDRTSARDEFWQIVHSMRDGLGATVDCEVFENIQACADTIALTLAGLYSQTDAIAWSEVQITTRIYDDPSHNAKSTFQASAKRTIPQPDWGQQPLAREVPDQTKARPKSRLSRHMSVDAVSAIDEVQTPGIGGEKIALDPDKEGSTTASYVHQDGTSSVSTAFHADATAMESGTSRIWRRGVVIALGSNMGDRIGEIEKACRAIDADPDMRIVDTSCLYESEPMYVEDQDRFINGVCEIETTLSPMDLLDRLQAIERGHGRVKLIEKGPRNIDLDILLFGDEVVSTERLTIPHALMHERAFVLKPVLDLQGFGDVHVPQSRQSLSSLLGRLEASSTKLDSITPLRSTSNFIRRNRHDRRTHVMSILNTTPDSFSDGGTYDVSSTSALADVAAAHIAAGATIIDIGGQSSRPNAPDVSAEEEINRVLPAIAAIRNLPEAAGIAISVDTYRAAVAEAAVNAGAHIINDISAGTLDPLMHKTVAELGCTYIMMHMRGTPSTMSSPEHCTYKNGVLSGIQDEVIDRINDAVAVGIRKWRIMIDPGIGFAKTSDQNVEILRQLSIRQMQRLNGVEYNRGLGSRLKRYPMLLGSSRKGFIGNVTGVKEPKDRLMGTAATVTAAVIAGADIVRVHDVAEMAQVVKMADAIYRFPQQAAGRQGKVTSASALKCEPKQSPWRSQRTDGR